MASRTFKQGDKGAEPFEQLRQRNLEKPTQRAAEKPKPEPKQKTED